MILWIKYVRHSERPLYDADPRWKYAGELPGPHKNWSVQYEWVGSGDPVMPKGVVHELR